MYYLPALRDIFAGQIGIRVAVRIYRRVQNVLVAAAWARLSFRALLLTHNGIAVDDLTELST